MTRVGLLHTVPALAATFDGMLADSGVDRVHIADAHLLQTAIREGVTDAVRASVAAHLQHLVAGGADAILVTCSSIGEAAEEAGELLAVPVVRVDAAMARDAVSRALAVAGARAGDGGAGGGAGAGGGGGAAGGAANTAHIVVLATNTATLGPTTRLIEREIDVAAAGASSAGSPADASAAVQITVASAVVEGAVAARDAGRPDEHDELIAKAVAAAAHRSSERPADVIVLAQASMAAAADRAAVSVPILTSPAGGVAALQAALAASPAPAPAPAPALTPASQPSTPDLFSENGPDRRNNSGVDGDRLPEGAR